MIFIPHKGLESPASKYTFQSHFRKGQGTLEGEQENCDQVIKMNYN